jgi:hypothetical protein
VGRSEEVTRVCPHAEQDFWHCSQCVTVMLVALGVLDHTTIDEVAALADSYAEKIADDLPHAESEASLIAGLSGALLCFLADAVRLANSA